MTDPNENRLPGDSEGTATIRPGGNWFPGRIVGGIALVVGPLLWIVGLFLRALPFKIGIFTPEQLEFFDSRPFGFTAELHAYQEVPALVIAGYATFLLAVAVLLPAYIAFAALIGRTHPRLALWGGLSVCMGLFARFYFAGVDQTAFQLSDEYGLDWAIQAVTATYQDLAYGPWRVSVWLSIGQYIGMALLVVAAHRSGILGTGRCLLLAASGMIWVGVLKGSEIYALTLAVLACVVLVPLGVRMLRDRVTTVQRRWLSW